MHRVKGFLLCLNCFIETEVVMSFFKSVECNISIKFPRQNLYLPQLNPGLTQGRSIIINDSQDFFGNIKVSWNNLYDEKIIRNFSLKKNDLPSFLIQKILVIFRFISRITTFKLSLMTPRIQAIKPLKWI